MHNVIPSSDTKASGLQATPVNPEHQQAIRQAIQKLEELEASLPKIFPSERNLPLTDRHIQESVSAIKNKSVQGCTRAYLLNILFQSSHPQGRKKAFELDVSIIKDPTEDMAMRLGCLNDLARFHTPEAKQALKELALLIKQDPQSTEHARAIATELLAKNRIS